MAATKAFDKAEICEIILEFSLPADILTMSQVSCQIRANIQGSQKTRRALFLVSEDTEAVRDQILNDHTPGSPLGKGLVRLNPLLFGEYCTDFYAYSLYLAGPGKFITNVLVGQMPVVKEEEFYRARTELSSSCRDMFLTQPPVVEIRIGPKTQNWANPPKPRLRICHPKGVRFRHLVELKEQGFTVEWA